MIKRINSIMDKYLLIGFKKCFIIILVFIVSLINVSCTAKRVAQKRVVLNFNSLDEAIAYRDEKFTDIEINRLSKRFNRNGKSGNPYFDKVQKYIEESGSVISIPGKNTSVKTEERNVSALKSIYENTIKYWQYDEAAYFYNYTPQERIQSGRGICWDYALFFYNKCQEKGMSNIHFVVSNNLQHAWNELWIDDTVYIIDTTWADTNPYESIDKYFMVDASYDEEHYQIDICVVDDTMEQNDISSLYRGILTQDSKRQKYTAARPIVKLKR